MYGIRAIVVCRGVCTRGEAMDFLNTAVARLAPLALAHVHIAIRPKDTIHKHRPDPHREAPVPPVLSNQPKTQHATRNPFRRPLSHPIHPSAHPEGKRSTAPALNCRVSVIADRPSSLVLVVLVQYYIAQSLQVPSNDALRSPSPVGLIARPFTISVCAYLPTSGTDLSSFIWTSGVYVSAIIKGMLSQPM